MVNIVVVVVVIWLAGVSVKDFACIAVGQLDEISEGTRSNFNERINNYLLQVGLVAGATATLVHYGFVRRFLGPLRELTRSVQVLANGAYPEPIPSTNHDEIGALTRSFNQMTLTLQREAQIRKQLMSDISNELRTPLSNLNGYLEALSDGVVEGNRELYASLRDESLHLTKLVEQLHQLNIWETRQISDTEKEVLDIRALLLQVAQLFQLECEKKKIDLIIEAQQSKLFVHEQGIRQVFTNLLGNAILYNVGTEIDVKGKKDHQYYRISITNKGEDIPKNKQTQVFDRFVKVDSSRCRNRENTGSGLGLAIVKEIVEQHGGQVGLETDGQKHTFWVALPYEGT
ncbi:ATP-binding protein [Paenibacillus provencensis]|uniref:histidine kinase n=1 Tax=Paenibacillus provencensis TaxID=441151 RepID=A0ABW3PVC1_9BACL